MRRSFRVGISPPLVNPQGTTRQAGVTSFSGATLAAPDLMLGFPKLDHLARLPSRHGVINMPSDPIGSRE